MNGAGVVMRRRTALELCDLAVVLLRAERGHALPATLVAWTVAAIVAATAWFVLDPWAGVAAGVVAGRLAQTPWMVAAGARVAGTPPAAGVRATARAWLTLAPWTALTSVATLLLAVFPPAAAWIWLQSSFLAEVLLLERPEREVGARLGALLRAGLGQAVVVRAFGVVLELWAVLAVLLLGDLVVGELLDLGTPFGHWADGDASPLVLVGSWAVQPLLGLSRFAAYLDVRTRREGLDVWFSLWTAAGARGIG